MYSTLTVFKVNYFFFQIYFTVLCKSQTLNVLDWTACTIHVEGQGFKNTDKNIQLNSDCTSNR